MLFLCKSNTNYNRNAISLWFMLLLITLSWTDGRLMYWGGTDQYLKETTLLPLWRSKVPARSSVMTFTCADKILIVLPKSTLKWHNSEELKDLSGTRKFKLIKQLWNSNEIISLDLEVINHVFLNYFSFFVNITRK